LKAARSKRSMAAAATRIVCLSCVPVTGGPVIPTLCSAYGLLFAKTFG